MVPAQAAPATLVLLGDSLSAAYGIDPARGWAALLQGRLAQNGLNYNVVNASISGDTTAGGLSRLPALLETHKPKVVIIALGANDGLRGLPLAAMRKNITDMVGEAKAAGAKVLLVGMRLPPNYGPRYTAGFTGVYSDVAQTEGIALVPFLLEGLATDLNMSQRDTLHPTAAAQPRMLENVWPALLPLL